jgi:biopolymer transport protein ExbB
MNPSTTDLSGAAMSPLQQLISMGGPVMWVLLGLAVAGLVAFFYLIISGALFAPRLTKRLRGVVDQWQQQPTDHCADQAGTSNGWRSRTNPMRQMIATAMSGCRQQRDATALREELARRSQQALKPFEAPLKIIEVIAALAPLLGLLGTVMGMMSAFSAMSVAEGQANASKLSGGIYEALTTTAAGLVVAIPLAAIAAWAEFRLRRLNLMINDTLVRIITTPIENRETRAASTEKPAPAVASESRTSQPDVAYATG